MKCQVTQIHSKHSKEHIFLNKTPTCMLAGLTQFEAARQKGLLFAAVLWSCVSGVWQGSQTGVSNRSHTHHIGNTSQRRLSVSALRQIHPRACFSSVTLSPSTSCWIWQHPSAFTPKERRRGAALPLARASTLQPFCSVLMAVMWLVWGGGLSCPYSEQHDRCNLALELRQPQTRSRYYKP